MPDLAGRRRTAIAALLAASLLATIVPLATSSATAPPNLDPFLYALGQVESGGSYTAYNPTSGAYGKYQILPSNWPAWAKTYLGNADAPQTPANQEKVARGKVTALYWWLDAWPTVAHWWLTGSSERNPALWSSSSRRYVDRVMAIMTAAIGAAGPPPPPPIGYVAASTARLPETSARIAYSRGWSTASHTTYAGGQVRYSERDGATATLTFRGRSITWIGPTGSTRGRAQVTLDGVVLGIVDLRRSTFSPRVNLLTRSWPAVGDHVLEIRVVGDGRPVAIDEFVVVIR